MAAVKKNIATDQLKISVDQLLHNSKEVKNEILQKQ